MLYGARKETGETAALRRDIEPVVRGMGFSLVELTVSRHRGSCQVRAVVTVPVSEAGAGAGTDGLGRLHRTLLPRLDVALAEDGERADYSFELSSPGVGRTIKDGAEFACFTGRPVRCYLTERPDWVRGLLKAADDRKIVLENGDGEMELAYEKIAKAKLDD